MSITTFSVRMDSDVKRELDNFCSEVGMNTSTAINLFAKRVIRDKKLPFEISTKDPDPFYSDSNMERLTKSIANAKAGKITYHDLVEADDEESLD